MLVWRIMKRCSTICAVTNVFERHATPPTHGRGVRDSGDAGAPHRLDDPGPRHEQGGEQGRQVRVSRVRGGQEPRRDQLHKASRHRPERRPSGRDTGRHTRRGRRRDLAQGGHAPKRPCGHDAPRRLLQHDKQRDPHIPRRQVAHIPKTDDGQVHNS